MQEYGPARMYWEGGFKGEGILRNVKPVVTQGTHMSWFATSALQRYYSEKSMGLLLLSQNDGDTNEIEKVQKIDSYYDRKVYNYRQGCCQIKLDIVTGKPVSAAYCKKTGIAYCIVIENKKRLMVQVDFIDELGVWLGNTYYTPIKLRQDNTINVGDYEDFTSIMVLPHRVSNEIAVGHEPIFYCITEDWTERSKLPDGRIEFCLPKIDGVSY
jgi:hypothetical protein